QRVPAPGAVALDIHAARPVVQRDLSLPRNHELRAGDAPGIHMALHTRAEPCQPVRGEAEAGGGGGLVEPVTSHGAAGAGATATVGATALADARCPPVSSPVGDLPPL